MSSNSRNNFRPADHGISSNNDVQTPKLNNQDSKGNRYPDLRRSSRQNLITKSRNKNQSHMLIQEPEFKKHLDISGLLDYGDVFSQNSDFYKIIRWIFIFPLHTILEQTSGSNDVRVFMFN